jgi:hypothetical protein
MAKAWSAVVLDDTVADRQHRVPPAVADAPPQQGAETPTVVFESQPVTG